MYKSNATFIMIFVYLQTKLTKSLYEKKNDDVNFQASMKFTTDFFSHNIPYLVRSISCLDNKANIKILEVGSFEGRSTIFLLNHFPESTIQVVDTWSGSDEHQNFEKINELEDRFDSNVSFWSDRVKKYKGKSIEYYSNSPIEFFDLVYIDGSHFADDVMIDAVEGFRRLKSGGVMVFDDYLWRWYSDLTDNPAVAINSFLKIKRGKYNLISIYHQIVIQKI